MSPHSTQKSILRCLVVATGLAVAITAGCDSSGLNVSPVSGKVTLEGKPLTDARITFIPSTSTGESYGATGKTNANGEYTLMTGEEVGAVPGSYKVLVSRPTNPDGTLPDPTSGLDTGLDPTQLLMQGKLIESVPRQYSDMTTTPLTFEVTAAGSDKADFALVGGDASGGAGGIPGGIPGGAGGIPGGVPGGVPGGIPGGVPGGAPPGAGS